MSKNVKDLRLDLIEIFEQMKNGVIDIKTGKELMNASGKILATARTEMDYNKLTENDRAVDFLEVEDAELVVKKKKKVKKNKKQKKD